MLCSTEREAGFSLVELIVVVTIMAVLTAILAPAYLHYLEKSRIGADENTAEEIRRATETIVLSGEYDVTEEVLVTFSAAGITVTDAPYASKLEEELRTLFPSFPSVVPKSKKYKDAVYEVKLNEGTMESLTVLGEWKEKETE